MTYQITFLLLSIIFQIAAVVFAFRLIPLTKKRLAWAFVSAAIFLMVLRRIATLVEISHPSRAGFLAGILPEVISLFISGFMLAGILLIAPIFKERFRVEADLSNAKHNLERLNQILIAIHNINQLITRERDTHRLINEGCNILIKTRGYRFAWVGLVQEGSYQVLPVGKGGFEDDYLSRVKITWDDSEYGQGPTGTAIKTKKPFVMRDIEHNLRFAPWREEALKRGYAASAALPLLTGEKVLGALNVYAESPDTFDDEELHLLGELASDLSLAVQSIQDEQAYRQTKDDLQNTRKSFYNVVENSPDGIIIVDRNGVVRFINSATKTIFGDKADKLVGDIFEFPALTDKTTEIDFLRDGEAGTGEMHVAETDWAGESVYLISIRDITERKRAEENIRRHLHRLGALHEIDQAISNSLDINLSLNVLVGQVTTQGGVDAAGVLLLNPHTQKLEYAAGLGFHTPDIKQTELRLGQGYAGLAALERRLVSVPNLNEAKGGLKRPRLLPGEGFIAGYFVPITAKAQIKGVLEVFQRTPFIADSEWLEFLKTLAVQAAIAIDNAEMVNNLQRSNIDLSLAYDATLEGWSRALDLRDKETEGHTQRVTEMALRLARSMGVRGDELVHMRRGALLHDIGKMGIPDSILLKPGPLSDEEWEIMRKHPVYAQRLLSPIPFLRSALDIPYCHHEKWDGTGYPRGLKSDQIPLAARIFAVADVWDALRSDRPYRPAWPEDKVREHIRSLAGTHFDPKVVQVFLETAS